MAILFSKNKPGRRWRPESYVGGHLSGHCVAIDYESPKISASPTNLALESMWVG